MSSDSAPEWPVLSIAEAHARLTAPGQRYEMEEMEIRGVLQRVWKNAPPTLRDIFLNARAFGPREFLVYEDDRATYEAFARAAIQGEVTPEQRIWSSADPTGWPTE